MTNYPSFKTPSSSGYRMPAEWERHDSIWFCWPHDATDYPCGLDKVQKTYVQIIKAISNSEKVQLIVKNDPTKKRIESLLEKETIDSEQVNFYIFKYADIWIRDYGPTFIVNQNEKKLAMIHWIFNAWGEKHEELKDDTVIPSLINQSMNIPCFTPGIILEGGSIEVSGAGTLITTEQCLLNKNRNPNLSKTEIEKCLMEYVGVKKIIWLKEGIAGDDTDGHVDNIARFVSPSTLLCAYEDDKDDENFAALKNNYDILQNSTDQDGNSYNITKLPMPGFVENEERRLPASYANFYIGNDVVLVPVFGHRNDKKALDIIRKCFPTRETVGINCAYLLYGGGAVHCISQQQPAIS